MPKPEIAALDVRIKENQQVLNQRAEMIEQCGGTPSARQHSLIEQICLGEIKLIEMKQRYLLDECVESDRQSDKWLRAVGVVDRLREQLAATIRYDEAQRQDASAPVLV